MTLLKKRDRLHAENIVFSRQNAEIADVKSAINDEKAEKTMRLACFFGDVDLSLDKKMVSTTDGANHCRTETS